jgi:type IV pilus assembly protein PilB
MAKQQKKLGEILVDWGIISQKEVAKALEHGKAKNMRIGEALVDLNLCSESNVYKALAQQHNMEYFDLEKSSVPANAATLVPKTDAQASDPAALMETAAAPGDS